MIGRKLLAIFIMMVITQKALFAQDAAFSQFYANPLFLNPALSGSTECGRLHLNYRNQWPSISNAFVTYSISYDQSLDAINSGFGFLVMADQQGDAAYNRTMAGGSYAYTAKISNTALLSFGIKAAYYQEKLNWEKLIFADQINASTGSISASSGESRPDQTEISTVDFGAGLMLAFEDMFLLALAATT